jgi:cytosine/adenosine deaminase-related metal-dependent hydrolase
LDRELGSLERGKAADMIVVRRPGAIGGWSGGRGQETDARPESEVSQAQVLVARATAADVQLVMIGGQVVYEAGSPAEGAQDEVDLAFQEVRGKLGLSG